MTTRARTLIEAVAIDGRAVYIEQISAAVGCEFAARLSAAQGWHGEFEAIRWLLSKAITDADGQHFLDSDEGRQRLEEIDYQTYNTLVSEVCRINGYAARPTGEDKKN